MEIRSLYSNVNMFTEHEMKISLEKEKTFTFDDFNVLTDKENKEKIKKGKIDELDTSVENSSYLSMLKKLFKSDGSIDVDYLNKSYNSGDRENNIGGSHIFNVESNEKGEKEVYVLNKVTMNYSDSSNSFGQYSEYITMSVEEFRGFIEELKQGDSTEIMKKNYIANIKPDISLPLDAFAIFGEGDKTLIEENEEYELYKAELEDRIGYIALNKTDHDLSLELDLDDDTYVNWNKGTELDGNTTTISPYSFTVISDFQESDNNQITGIDFTA